jgi:ribosomal-protein-serine acetyltransferase
MATRGKRSSRTAGRRPRHVPTSFETERLLIRAPRPGDGAAVNEAVRETIKKLQWWMPWAKNTPTARQSEAFVRRSARRYRARTEFNLTGWDRRSRDFVLASGLHPRAWSVPSFEIGYWIRRRAEGKGLVTEAVKAIAAFGFDVLRAARLEIRCDTRNRRSARVALRCGFVLEGVHRLDSRDNAGTLRSTCLFACTAAMRDLRKIPRWGRKPHTARTSQ